MALSPSGRRIRRAARVLLLDGADRLLLFRFTFAGHPAFWATPGGEAEPHEGFAEAAIRELREETGITADPGPEIARRIDDFQMWNGEPITAHEAYFRIQMADCVVDTSGHTELERDIMLDHRWFTRAELGEWPETIFPADILALLGGTGCQQA